MPALAMRVDGLRFDGDEGGWAFRFGWAVGKALGVCFPHLVEGPLALCYNDGDAIEEHIGGREERQGHVMMLVFVPRDVTGQPLADFLLVVKTGRHVWLRLHRVETRFSVRVIVGYLWATEARCDGALIERILL